ncbi:hypothetical protein Vafri_17110 [Volvox africanus]|uniref:tRNA (guanine(9)-N(1))-methyltransferase n=1 Tax=Volvox africanus TaxID=51714 RepID=A0A8J4F737_9CHLO|nr:hypothetical protein Vafri_17110 [Volvox africanus]
MPRLGSLSPSGLSCDGASGLCFVPRHDTVLACSPAPGLRPPHANGRTQLRSLCKQIENSSAINKRYPRPACLTLTSWGEPLASAAAPCGAAGWRLVKLEEGPAEAFGPTAVVVLSPDAAEPLLDLDSERCVYVIGGIVDRTHRKGLTLKYAEARQVECRRLPIAEHAEQLGLGKGTRKWWARHLRVEGRDSRGRSNHCRLRVRVLIMA